MSPGMVLNYLRTSSTILSVALPTLFMTIAENQYGSKAPTISPMKTFGDKTSTVTISARLTKAPKRARDTNATEPMAKPFMHKNPTYQLEARTHFHKMMRVLGLFVKKSIKVKWKGLK
jgi:hypothetical protein